MMEQRLLDEEEEEDGIVGVEYAKSPPGPSFREAAEVARAREAREDM